MSASHQPTHLVMWQTEKVPKNRPGDRLVAARSGKGATVAPELVKVSTHHVVQVYWVYGGHIARCFVTCNPNIRDNNFECL